MKCDSRFQFELKSIDMRDVELDGRSIEISINELQKHHKHVQRRLIRSCQSGSVCCYYYLVDLDNSVSNICYLFAKITQAVISSNTLADTDSRNVYDQGSLMKLRRSLRSILSILSAREQSEQIDDGKIQTRGREELELRKSRRACYY